MLPSHSPMIRRLLAAATVLALVLLAPWLWAEHRLGVELDAWAARARAAGWTVRYGAPGRGGWPLAAALELPEPSLSGPVPGLPGGVAWSAPSLRLSVSLLEPGTLRLQPGGDGLLRAPPLPPLRVAAGSSSLALPLGGGAATLRATALSLTPLDSPGTEGGATAPWRAGRLRLRLSPGPADAPLGVDLEAADLVLPGSWPLGDAVAALRLSGLLRGAPPPADAPSPTVALLRWRDGGGAVVLDRVEAQWGPLGIAGSARLRLDETLRPAGHADLQLTGWSEALDVLRARGAVGAGAAVAARTVLGLLARTPAAGGPSVVSLPVTLAEGKVSVGQIPLLRLPEMGWAGP